MSPLTKAAVLSHWQEHPSEPFELDRPPESSGILSNPEKHKKLGDGHWGEVYASQDPSTGDSWAIKCCYYNPERDPPFGPVEREYRILKTVQGAPHTVSLEGICRSAGKVELAMERVRGFDLAQWLMEQNGVCTFNTFKTITKQLLTALAAYHARGVAHGDIKLENCIFNPQTKELKIVDFGAAFLPKDENFLEGGTLGSIAPELLIAFDSEHFEKAPPADYAMDIWALGVMLFTVYANAPLFTGEGFTIQDTLALIATQFRKPFLEYTGTLLLAQKNNRAPDEIKQTCTLEEIRKAGHLPPLRKEIPPSYKRSWEERIKHFAAKKHELKYANKIIKLIANMLACDPSKRITAEEGLNLWGRLFQEHPRY